VVGARERGKALQAARVAAGVRGEVRGEDGGAVGDGRACVELVGGVVLRPLGAGARRWHCRWKVGSFQAARRRLARGRVMRVDARVRSLEVHAGVDYSAWDEIGSELNSPDITILQPQG
jgi:hypothetical protein